MGSKKQTVGYWYKLLLHFGWCQGPIDAFLEFRGGDRTAWKGELTQSGQIQIAGGNIWGGDEKEGGIEGAFDVMLGEQTQQPNDYLAANLGPEQTAYRGKATGVFRGGRYGAYNPYPKPASFKLRRILKGWDNDAPWYPEKAAVPVGAPQIFELGPTSDGWSFRIGPGDVSYAETNYDDSAWEVGASPFASSTNHPYAAQGGYPDQVGTTWPTNTTIWIRRKFVIPDIFSFALEIFVDNFATVWVNGVLVLPRQGTSTHPGADAFLHRMDVPASVLVAGENVIALKAEDLGSYSYAAFKVASGSSDLLGMNAAHVLYDSLFSMQMQGEPVADADDTAFREAADKLHGENFGICTSFDPQVETIEAFQQRICNVIGGSLSKSRVDGRWRLLLVRGDYDVASLPVLTDDDILEWSEEPSTLDDAANQVTVEWFDPQQKEKRVTAPQQSLGAIQAFGGIVSESTNYPEIPYEPLAIRVAARDLQAKATPLRRFELVANRIAAQWSAGSLFRLQAPRRGIADMVCLIGSLDAGTTRSSVVRLSAVQSVFGLPSSSYITPEPGIDTGPSEIPVPAADQLAFEVPYVELAGYLGNADLAALPEDAGFVALAAQQPGGMLNYTLRTSADGAAGENVGQADWCPTATLNEAASHLSINFTIADGDQIGLVEIGSAAIWGGEIVRVDAIDPHAATITLARGCADTVPVKHPVGERLWFYDAWAAIDPTEYSVGEVLAAKALSRTVSALLDEALAPVSSIELRGRAARPYPPGRFQINGEDYPGSAFGEIVITGMHRDRILQADQLVDTAASDIGPEPGVTYTARFSIDGALVHIADGVTAFPIRYSPTTDGELRIEVAAERSGLPSWQAHEHTLSYTTAEPSFYTNALGDRYVDAEGNYYIQG